MIVQTASIVAASSVLDNGVSQHLVPMLPCPSEAGIDHRVTEGVLVSFDEGKTPKDQPHALSITAWLSPTDPH